MVNVAEEEVIALRILSHAHMCGSTHTHTYTSKTCPLIFRCARRHMPTDTQYF